VNDLRVRGPEAAPAGASAHSAPARFRMGASTAIASKVIALSAMAASRRRRFSIEGSRPARSISRASSPEAAAGELSSWRSYRPDRAITPAGSASRARWLSEPDRPCGAPRRRVDMPSLAGGAPGRPSIAPPPPSFDPRLLWARSSPTILSAAAEASAAAPKTKRLEAARKLRTYVDTVFRYAGRLPLWVVPFRAERDIASLRRRVGDGERCCRAVADPAPV